ncbi:hypothetical protein ABH926_009957 [Catenulispora sp. GP43]|uniref:hypothetical protein n=1 Tax=Catenulispora sp. GP43 TaxID=3156263 RepID=UPI003519920A
MSSDAPAATSSRLRIQDIPQHLPFPQPEFDDPGEWARWMGEISYELLGPGVCKWPPAGHDPNERKFIATGGELLY